jgi:Leucine-rich repeat (LRR) protein
VCNVCSGPVSTSHTLGANDWLHQLHSVVLEGRGLRGLAGLAAAHRLVAANLADNLISDLADLAGCTGIQQLNISNNLVSEVRSSPTNLAGSCVATCLYRFCLH